MEKKWKLCFFLLFILGVLSGCSAIQDSLKGSQGSTGEEGPKLVGNWVGFIGMVSQSGFEIQDKSNILVTVSNPSDLSSFSLNSPKTATTNAQGKFVVKGLQTGTYTLTFSKAGYGELKFYNQQFVGDGDVFFTAVPGTYTSYCLSEIPTYTISSCNAVEEYGYKRLLIKTDILFQGTTYHNARIFFSTSPTVSKDNYITTTIYNFSSADSNGFSTLYMYSSQLNKFLSGTTVYVRVYPDGNYPYAEGMMPGIDYFDPVLGKTIFCCLGDPSEVISFVI